MAQFYSLEEAARVLGMSPEELTAKAQAREVRAFMDSGTWQFRVADIDEMARQRGMGSDPDLSLSDLDLVAQPGGSGLGDIDLSEYQLDVADPASGDLAGSDSDADIEVDDRSLPPMTGSSSTIIGMEHAGKSPSDSDVRLMPEPGIDASDSDVRLATSTPPPSRKPSDSDVTLVSDDDLGPVPGSSDAFPVTSPDETGIRQAPLLGSSEEVTSIPSGGGSSGADETSDSDFELTPSSVIDALQPESGSDFELSALDESDEFEATPLRGPSDSDVTAADPSASGINLGRPSDSGINLQGVSGLGLDQSDSIELAPLDDDEPAPRPAAKLTPAPAPAPASKAKAEKDIFEDTDFEVDALDVDDTDQTVQLEAGSDYDLEEDELDSGSEVFAVDEDDVDQNAATAMASGIMIGEDDDEEEEESGESADAWDLGGGAEDEAPVAARGVSASPALVSGGGGGEWGGLWVGLLGVATLLTLLLAFVSLDLVRNLYDYRGPTPISSGLVKMLAGLAGGS